MGADPIMQIPGPQAPQPVSIPAGGNQTLTAISTVLQALRAGHAKMQLEKFDDAQRAYMGAKAQADAAKQYLASLPPGDPHAEAAQKNLDAATQALATQTKALTDFAQGQNSGGGKSKGGAPGAQPQQSSLGKVLQRATQVLLGGHGPQTAAPQPVSPTAPSAPQIPTGPTYENPNSLGSLTA